jgi:hypothetical protein
MPCHCGPTACEECTCRPSSCVPPFAQALPFFAPLRSPGHALPQSESVQPEDVRQDAKVRTAPPSSGPVSGTPARKEGER